MEQSKNQQNTENRVPEKEHPFLCKCLYAIRLHSTVDIYGGEGLMVRETVAGGFIIAVLTGNSLGRGRTIWGTRQDDMGMTVKGDGEWRP